MTRHEAARLYAATLLAAGYTRLPRGGTVRSQYAWNKPDGTRSYTGDRNGLLFTTLPPEACAHLMKPYTWHLVAEAADILNR